MFNRWLSFYNKELPGFVNETLNKFGSIFDDKQEAYKLYYYLIPRLKWQRMTYIKKKKKEEDEVEGLNVIAKNKNISKRELQQYVELEKILRK